MSAQDAVLYLTVGNVVEMHEKLIELHGGTQGVRDMGLIEAAIGRHQSGYYADRIEEAAALMQSLVQNHPFLDGNKRIGFAAAQVFLETNGHKISADSKSMETQMLGLIERSAFTFENVAAMLKEACQKR